MTTAASNLIDVDVDVHHETEKAFGIWTGKRNGFGGRELTWLPKQFVEDNGNGSFTMPEWLAVDKGLI